MSTVDAMVLDPNGGYLMKPQAAQPALEFLPSELTYRPTRFKKGLYIII